MGSLVPLHFRVRHTAGLGRREPRTLAEAKAISGVTPSGVEALFNHAQRSRQPSQKRMHPQLARRKLLLGGGADGYVEKLDANEACH